MQRHRQTTVTRASQSSLHLLVSKSTMVYA